MSVNDFHPVFDVTDGFVVNGVTRHVLTILSGGGEGIGFNCSEEDLENLDIKIRQTIMLAIKGSKS